MPMAHVNSATKRRRKGCWPYMDVAFRISLYYLILMVCFLFLELCELYDYLRAYSNEENRKLPIGLIPAEHLQIQKT